ncbi:hypothetical protein M0804_006673 [Polistes exclamans]|nr:hypothetical protein M0804_006673 [Polistes exclamans]
MNEIITGKGLLPPFVSLTFCDPNNITVKHPKRKKVDLTLSNISEFSLLNTRQKKKKMKKEENKRKELEEMYANDFLFEMYTMVDIFNLSSNINLHLRHTL